MPGSRIWGSAAGPVNLFHAGTYAVGHDTLAPRLHLLGEGSGGGDSSWAEFVVQDNVRLVNLKCFPEGAEGVTAVMRQEQSGVPFRLAFKPQAGLVPLKLFLSVDDGRMQSAFPLPPARHHVLSRFLPDFRAPLALKAGLEWELFGLPVSPASGLTLESLAKATGAADAARRLVGRPGGHRGRLPHPRGPGYPAGRRRPVAGRRQALRVPAPGRLQDPFPGTLRRLRPDAAQGLEPGGQSLPGTHALGGFQVRPAGL